MFHINGQVVSFADDTVGQKNTPIRKVRLMVGDKYKRIETVKDFGMNSYKVGETVQLPVMVKAFAFRSGGAGLDIVRINERS